MVNVIVAFVSGLVFAIGLGLAGMTRPSRVVGFLDVAGKWDPTLLFVMGGAVLTGLILFPLILRRPRALSGAAFALPTRRSIDGELVLGAILFGVGWGLSGYCPGPAIVSLPTGAPSVVVFVTAMLGGMALANVVQRRRQSTRPASYPAAP